MNTSSQNDVKFCILLVFIYYCFFFFGGGGLELKDEYVRIDTACIFFNTLLLLLIVSRQLEMETHLTSSLKMKNCKMGPRGRCEMKVEGHTVFNQRLN